MSQSLPHPDLEENSVNCAIITVSDSRNFESDRSGQIIQEKLAEAGHQILSYVILPDEPSQIKQQLADLSENVALNVVILNGGTGISSRDTTYDLLETMLEKTLPGFGEIFRNLSYQEIGSRAIASRSTAGIYHQKVIFSLPGSSHAVKLAMEKLILPELRHLVKQISL
jgi:molybdenum cofactor biosynthesis protein B